MQTTTLCTVSELATTLKTVGALALDVLIPISLAVVAAIKTDKKKIHGIRTVKLSEREQITYGHRSISL